jgi:uncharacterized membrane protein
MQADFYMRNKNVLLFGSKFLGGGSAYGVLEILWRGFTHISMIILGGICFVGLLHISKYKLNLAVKSLVGGTMITIAELFVGIVLNIWLGLGIWDYSGQRFQLLGQVSLLYFFLWCGLSFLVLVGCRLARLVPRQKEIRRIG